MSNPFFCGNPVPPDQFLDRQEELWRITGRILNQGQSTAVMGEPRSGKTSLLWYLKAPEKRAMLYNADGQRLLFSYLDAQTLGEKFNQAQFWEYALHPLHGQVITPSLDSPIAQAYQVCRENEFGCFVLERLFAQMVQSGWRLVVMLDEFDLLLHHPILNSAEFFGSLRHLASLSQGALALVIASRHSLADLGKDTQQFSHGSSPYFNFLEEVTLGSWPDESVAELLCRAGDRFASEDRRFIRQMAGEHPYLLQAAAYDLWLAYELSASEDNLYLRRQQAWRRFLDKAGQTLDDSWQLWSQVMRQAFAAVALADMPRLLKRREFHVKSLVHDLHDLGPELAMLRDRGFVKEDETAPGGWQVRPQAFLWWLADELVRTVRDETSFEEWLKKRELGILLTKSEKEQLSKTIRAASGLLKGGITTLIEAAAKGVGEVVMKGG